MKFPWKSASCSFNLSWLYVRWDVNGVLLSYGTVIRWMPIWFMVNLLELKLRGCMNDHIGNISFRNTVEEMKVRVI